MAQQKTCPAASLCPRKTEGRKKKTLIHALRGWGEKLSNVRVCKLFLSLRKAWCMIKSLLVLSISYLVKDSELAMVVITCLYGTEPALRSTQPHLYPYLRPWVLTFFRCCCAEGLFWGAHCMLQFPKRLTSMTSSTTPVKCSHPSPGEISMHILLFTPPCINSHATIQ